jgi:hypothetical protein
VSSTSAVRGNMVHGQTKKRQVERHETLSILSQMFQVLLMVLQKP